MLGKAVTENSDSQLKRVLEGVHKMADEEAESDQK